ncbi:MAG: hypothetical protein JXR70_15710, partial [Spirochaetales bacterium]|nr:hypothetical protein [Spirochaetales bacterium]
LSEEHQNQIDKMIRENPKLTKDILAQTFGPKEATMTIKILDEKIAELKTAHDPDNQIPALEQMKLMADKVQISPKKLTAMIDMILEDPRLLPRDNRTFCNVGTLIGNYLLGSEMHRLTGKHGFLRATELIQKARKSSLNSKETGVYKLTPEIIQFAANLGFPTMAGAETTKVKGTSHVAMGAVRVAGYNSAVGVRLGGPGSDGSTYPVKFHDYTNSRDWEPKVLNLKKIEYYFIAP